MEDSKKFFLETLKLKAIENVRLRDIETERIEESEKVMPFEKFRRIIEKLSRVDKDE